MSEPASVGADIAVRVSELPVVAIVGRPNVGKSTLFNRLVRRRQAIVRDEPGTTRDRNYGDAEWRGRHFTVIDTGGLLGEQLTGPYADSVADQVTQAVSEADAIVLVVDVQAGVLRADAEVAELLRRAEQPVTLCVNKADNAALRQNIGEFFGLGLGDPVAISAHHGRHIDELLDRVAAELPQSGPQEAERADCRLAIIGRPNVGKSSLVNAIVRDERMIVSEGAGHDARRGGYVAEFRGALRGAGGHGGDSAARAGGTGRGARLGAARRGRAATRRCGGGGGRRARGDHLAGSAHHRHGARRGRGDRAGDEQARSGRNGSGPARQPPAAAGGTGAVRALGADCLGLGADRRGRSIRWWARRCTWPSSGASACRRRGSTRCCGRR